MTSELLESDFRSTVSAGHAGKALSSATDFHGSPKLKEMMVANDNRAN